MCENKELFGWEVTYQMLLPKWIFLSDSTALKWLVCVLFATPGLQDRKTCYSSPAEVDLLELRRPEIWQKTSSSIKDHRNDCLKVSHAVRKL